MLASYMDSTNLKPEASKEDIINLCEQAVQYKMAAVCINPYRITAAKKILHDSGVNLCTVIGFPLGADGLSSKINTARLALEDGATELDMVLNIGAYKDRDYMTAEEEIKNILFLKNNYEFILKIIVETALLTEKELEIITGIISSTNADYIKTSTGFSSRGVNMRDIEIIKAHKSEKLKIKASGGVRDLDFALQLIDAGVNRIGSSSAAALIEKSRQRGGL